MSELVNGSIKPNKLSFKDKLLIATGVGLVGITGAVAFAETPVDCEIDGCPTEEVPNPTIAEDAEPVFGNQPSGEDAIIDEEYDDKPGTTTTVPATTTTVPASTTTVPATTTTSVVVTSTTPTSIPPFVVTTTVPVPRETVPVPTQPIETVPVPTQPIVTAPIPTIPSVTE